MVCLCGVCCLIQHCFSLHQQSVVISYIVFLEVNNLHSDVLSFQIAGVVAAFFYRNIRDPNVNLRNYL